MTRHAGKRVLFFAAAALLGGAVAAAQMGPGGGPPQQNPPGQQPPSGQQPRAPRPGTGNPGYPPGASPMGPKSSMSRSFADHAFVVDTLKGSAAEAQMSKLAAQKSSSNDVKQYGQRMVKIHTELAHQFTPIARALGVKVNQKPSRKQRRQIKRLKALSGPTFDRAYIEAMAKVQKHNVKEFKDEETAARSRAIKQCARMDAPVLSQHLKMLEQIAQNHQVPIGKKK